MKRLLLLGFFALTASGVLAQNAPPHLPGRTSQRGPSPNAIRNAELLNEAHRVERAGDLAQAESLYREVVLLNPKVDVFRFDLAEILDRMGREREAHREYRLALRRDERAWSSRQEDPRILARFGDLSLRYGNVREALDAYARGARFSQGDDFWAPRATPRDGSLTSLKAAAHAAAAIKLLNVGRDDEALEEMRASASADPSYWVPHFYLARHLDGGKTQEEAVREASLAEKLAPDAKARAMVKRLDVYRRVGTKKP